MKIKRIAIKEIQPDFFFHFTTPRDLSDLIASLDQGGLTTPLPVLPAASGYRLIGGFSRLAAASHLQWTHLHCRLLETERPVSEHLVHIVKSHMLSRPLNPVEQARLVAMTDLLVAEAALRRLLLADLALPQHGPRLEAYRRLAGWPQPVLDYLSRTDISIKHAAVFDLLAPDEQIFMAQWADDNGVRPVELGRIITLCREISRRESAPVVTVFQAAVAASSFIENRQQHVAAVKKTLTQRRFPALSAQRDAMLADERRLQMPRSVTLAWDRTLERPGVTLEVDLDSKQALLDLQKWLGDAPQISRLNRMIER